MTNRFWTLFSLAMLALIIAACAVSGNAETRACEGRILEGPWYRFLLPDGMEVDGGSNAQISASSVWLKTQLNGAPISFFLFAPRHGGKPYQIFLDSNDVRKLVDFDSDNGETIKYIISYNDGTIGLYEGNSQRITGLRVGDSALGQAEFEKYNCFLGSIEQYAE